MVEEKKNIYISQHFSTNSKKKKISTNNNETNIINLKKLQTNKWSWVGKLLLFYFWGCGFKSNKYYLYFFLLKCQYISHHQIRWPKIKKFGEIPSTTILTGENVVRQKFPVRIPTIGIFFGDRFRQMRQTCKCTILIILVFFN